MSILTIHFWDASSLIFGLGICFDRRILKWEGTGLAEIEQVDERVPLRTHICTFVFIKQTEFSL